jgi:hypothetical protein
LKDAIEIHLQKDIFQTSWENLVGITDTKRQSPYCALENALPVYMMQLE